jgi:hypothetical protein
MALLLARAVLHDLVTHTEVLDLGCPNVVVADVERIGVLEAVFDIHCAIGNIILLVVVMVEIDQLLAVHELVQNATLPRADPCREAAHQAEPTRRAR